MSKEISLTKGLVTIVDDDDFERLSRYSWFAKKNHKKFYAQRRWGPDHYQMHDEILPHPPGVTVDHINGNSLDNRKCNLRFATQQQQCFNRSKIAGTSSLFKGVSFHKGHRKWQSYIKHQGKSVSLGSYAEEDDAALAYDKAACRLFGEYAQLNFTLEDIQTMMTDLAEQKSALVKAGEERWGYLTKQERMF